MPPAARPGEGRAPVKIRRSDCRKVPRTPHAVRRILATSGAGPGSAFPAPPHEDARQGQPSPAVSLGLPRRGRRGKVPPHTIRRARERSLPLIPQLGKQNAALFPRKIPPPNIEPRRRARFRPPAPHGAARSKGAETTCFRCSQRCPQARPRRKVPDRHRQGRSPSPDRFRTELN